MDGVDLLVRETDDPEVVVIEHGIVTGVTGLDTRPAHGNNPVWRKQR